jgi:hypothetical protein
MRCLRLRELMNRGSMRLGEGASGGIQQKKRRSRYKTGDRQGQQTFQYQLVDYLIARIVICFVSYNFPKHFVQTIRLEC